MDKKLYPENWNEIALAVKTEAKWKCEECDRECKKSDESWTEFIRRVVPQVHCTYSYQLLYEINTKPTRFILTIAHLDHVPKNVERSNLKALCSVCHLRYDAKAMSVKKFLKRERQGQLNLFYKPGEEG